MSISILKKKKDVKVTVDNIYLGLRVRRGPDWKWGSQDHVMDGNGTSEPCVGTIHAHTIEPGQTNYSTTLYYKYDTDSTGNAIVWCRVQWDNGRKNEYRIGEKLHDLIVH